MGRRKPGKQRRTGKDGLRTFTLRELRPPGAAYEAWFIPAQAGVPIPDGLGEDAADIAARIGRLGPLYGGVVPQAALYLDLAMDSGKLAVLKEGEAHLIEVSDFLGSVPGKDMDLDGMRAAAHELHAIGALLVEPDEEYGIPFVRFVSRRPEKPGEPWGFVDDTTAPAASTCLPDGMWNVLSLEVTGAIAFLRSCLSQLEEPDLADFAERNRLGEAEARRLWDAAWASGFVDEKGCDACPAGHLCTREQ
ncbi:hypothetical protein [Streptomyces sp. NPDC059564]|uniref:hypothetical protein n=1 Tax=Streptomyces sp. NPDC059564 TaxID=3346865 RepID=UPI0036751587